MTTESRVPTFLTSSGTRTAALILLSFTALAGEVRAQQPLACGESMTRSLASGAADSFSADVTDAAVGQVDVTDLSGTIGDLRLLGSSPGDDNCDGALTFAVPADVQVSDCTGSDAGDYAIAFNIVSDDPENCGFILSNQPPVHAELTQAGEVDSYRFLFSTGDAKVLTPEVPSGSPQDVRIRVFDSSGNAVDVGNACGEVRFESVGTGFFTALVSACSGVGVFEYVLTDGPLTARPETLSCGQTLHRSLVPRDRDIFETGLVFDGVAIVDLADLSGSIGSFRIKTVGFGPLGTCTLSRYIDAPIEVRSCDDQSFGEYSISLNVVSDSFDHCGTDLRCGESVEAQLSLQGETDSFKLTASSGDVVSLAAMAPGIGALRLRLYSPGGDLLAETCSGELEVIVAETGAYTALVGACDGSPTAAYSIERLETESCLPPRSVGEYAYVALDTPAIGIVDLGVNRLTSAVLVNASSDRVGLAQLTRTASAGFVYAYFDEVSSILSINSTIKELVAEIPFSFEAWGFAPDPGGTFLYVPTAESIIIVDTAQRRFAGTIPLEPMGEEAPVGNAPSVVSPDGTRLYVLRGRHAAQRIDVVDLPTKMQIGSIVDARLSGVTDMDVTPDGRFLYLAAYPAGVIVVNTAQIAIETTIPDTGEVSSVAFSPVSNQAFVLRNAPAAPRQSSIVTVDTNTHAPTGSAELPTVDSSRIAVSPGGSRAIVIGASAGPAVDYEIVIFALDQNRVITSLPTDAEPFDVVAVRPPQGLCTGDTQLQTKVTVGELMTSVNFALDGCPGTDGP